MRLDGDSLWPRNATVCKRLEKLEDSRRGIFGQMSMTEFGTVNLISVILELQFEA